MKQNYQQQLDRIIDTLDGRPSLLLHSCCGPCSSYVLEYLTKHFAVTVFFANPCIFPESEYQHRLSEQQRLLAEMTFSHPVNLLPAPYQHDAFLQIAAGLAECPEGGERCTACFTQRLTMTAVTAKKYGFDYFGTTLTVSPHKDATRLNHIGNEIAGSIGVPFLPSDFKKKEGYKRSIELSREFDLYRQEYCGCEFSLAQK